VKVDGKYYLQYNRAKGMNSETGDAANKVAIVTSVTSGSRLVGQIDTSNSRFTGDNDLVIEVCSKDSSSGVESVVLSIGSSKSYCGDSIPTIGSASAESASSGEASSGLSLEAAIANAVCKAGGESCSSDAQCCGDTVCLGETSAARVCSGCLSLFETCSSNTDCCGGMKCSSGLCRAGWCGMHTILASIFRWALLLEGKSFANAALDPRDDRSIDRSLGLSHTVSIRRYS
jgi:hypothetical protein